MYVCMYVCCRASPPCKVSSTQVCNIYKEKGRKKNPGLWLFYSFFFLFFFIVFISTVYKVVYMEKSRKLTLDIYTSINTVLKT